MVYKKQDKDFNKWNRNKKILNKRTDLDNIFFYEKDIWWVYFGLNVGFEQDGKGKEFRRPVLVLKKFNQFVFLAVPLTTKIKNNKYYLKCDLGDNIPRFVIISQIKLIDSRRLIDKIGTINKTDFDYIRKAIKNMI